MQLNIYQNNITIIKHINLAVLIFIRSKMPNLICSKLVQTLETTKELIKKFKHLSLNNSLIKINKNIRIIYYKAK